MYREIDSTGCSPSLPVFIYQISWFSGCITFYLYAVFRSQCLYFSYDIDSMCCRSVVMIMVLSMSVARTCMNTMCIYSFAHMLLFHVW